MSSDRRKKTRSFAWFTALLFNLLLVAFGGTLFHLIDENQNAMGEEYITSSEAVTATQGKMSEMFARLLPEDTNPRAYWAGEVDRFLRDGDLTSARGMLLAAPALLNRKDSDAVQVAANSEKNGKFDDRLLAAATLFLPDDVRARYERITSPQIVTSLTMDDETPPETTEGEVNPDGKSSATKTDDAEETTPSTTGNNPAFFVLGGERDLAYQSANWLRGDRTDVFGLTISGIGLAAINNRFEKVELSEDAMRGASLVKAARRAGRLQPQLDAALERSLNQAVPPEILKANLKTTYSEGGSILIQGDALLDAFVKSTDEAKLEPFLSRLERISRLQENTPNSAALTLLELVSDQRDMKRAELIIAAGGVRAVTLAHYYGPETLTAAQTVMDWTMRLILFIMSCVALLMVLVWMGLSTFARSFGRGDSLGQHYGYS